MDRNVYICDSKSIALSASGNHSQHIFYSWVFASWLVNFSRRDADIPQISALQRPVAKSYAHCYQLNCYLQFPVALPCAQKKVPSYHSLLMRFSHRLLKNFEKCNTLPYCLYLARNKFCGVAPTSIDARLVPKQCAILASRDFCVLYWCGDFCDEFCVASSKAILLCYKYHY